MNCFVVVIGTLLVWILYVVIRHSPRRWWFYFWLISVPLAVLSGFPQPLVVDPMFHKFEPLAQKDPALTMASKKWCNAPEKHSTGANVLDGRREKTTGLNAYVTGLGASKRIVVWDTTIAKMNTQQIVFVAGHEMGHYVLQSHRERPLFWRRLLFCFSTSASAPSVGYSRAGEARGGFAVWTIGHRFPRCCFF